MPRYFSNARESIEEVFDREGDQLARANYKEPQFPDSEAIEAHSRIEVPLRSAYEEAQERGIDVETYLEG